MIKLSKILLDFSKTAAYLQSKLSKNTNIMSSAVYSFVKLENGSFYTILGKDVTDNRIYRFKEGGIGGNIREKVVDFLFDKLQNDSELTCIFDDVNGTYIEPCTDPLFREIELHYQEEVYYMIDRSKLSKTIISECLSACDAIWHSLCVVSSEKISKSKNQSIQKAEMIEFAKKAELILLGAYDGEGYIFWEKRR